MSTRYVWEKFNAVGTNIYGIGEFAQDTENTQGVSTGFFRAPANGISYGSSYTIDSNGNFGITNFKTLGCVGGDKILSYGSDNPLYFVIGKTGKNSKLYRITFEDRWITDIFYKRNEYGVCVTSSGLMFCGNLQEEDDGTYTWGAYTAGSNLWPCCVAKVTDVLYSKGTTSYGKVSASSSGAYPENGSGGGNYQLIAFSPALLAAALRKGAAA